MIQKYDILYIDPPWHYYGSKTKHAAAGKHYDLMSLAEICDLPITDMMSGSSVAFVWATGPRLDYAIQAIQAWGLHYRGVTYVWVKTRQDGGIVAGQGVPPTFTKPTTEFLLASTSIARGRPFPILSMNQAQVHLFPRGRHSAKPPQFRDLLVELCGDRPRLEMFARERVDGWDAWGNEAGVT